MKTAEEAWAEARQNINMADLASRLGVTRMAVSQWTAVPAERFILVANYIGVEPHVLRPDLFPQPKENWK